MRKYLIGDVIMVTAYGCSEVEKPHVVIRRTDEPAAPAIVIFEHELTTLLMALANLAVYFLEEPVEVDNGRPKTTA